jgi:hypothetical protein
LNGKLCYLNMNLQPDNIPAEMRALRRWCLHKIEARDGRKPGRVPYQRNGRHASSTDPSTWVPFERVYPVPAGFDGISFALAAGDGLVCIDFDGVRDPVTGIVEDWALGAVQKLDTYTEISGSGKGLHVFGYGEIERNLHPARSAVEFYSHDKIIAITGNTEFGLGSETLRQCDFGPLWLLTEIGDFVAPAPPVTQTSPRQGQARQGHAQHGDVDESKEDFRLLAQIVRRLRTRDVYKIEAEFQRRYPERFSRKTGSWPGGTYVRYTINRLLERTR